MIDHNAGRIGGRQTSRLTTVTMTIAIAGLALISNRTATTPVRYCIGVRPNAMQKGRPHQCLLFCNKCLQENFER